MKTPSIRQLMLRANACATGLAMLAYSAGTIAAFTNSVSTEPSIPLAQLPFVFHVAVVDIGGPITVVHKNVNVDGSQVDLSLCIRRGSSSTAPYLVKADIESPPLQVGTYTVRLTRTYQIELNSECTSPWLAVQTQMAVVGADKARTVVEYYNAPRDHFFQTADSVEIAALDAGQFVGWQRTGGSFSAYAPGIASLAPATVQPVCRYYGKPACGLDTHFFSAFSNECALIQVLWPDEWLLETADAFAVAIPSQADGSCPTGTNVVYRLFNGKSDVNHRYTTSLETRAQMVQKGWIPEGYGTVGVAMCAENF